MFQYHTAVFFMSVGTLIIMAFLVNENGRLTDKTKKDFRHTYLVISWASLMEWLGFILNGAPSYLRYFHIFVNCFGIILNLSIAFLFMIQLNENGIVKKHLFYFLIAAVLFLILSLPSGIIFYVDQYNIYHQGRYYYIYTIIYIMMWLLLLLGFLDYGRTQEKRNKLSLFSIAFFVLVCTLFQRLSAIQGLNISYLSLTIAAVLLFIYYEEFYQQRMEREEKRKTILLERDALTGLYSRYAYGEELRKYNVEAVPDEMYVFLFDISGLKRVNDIHGHEMGDKLIRAVSRALIESLPSLAKIYRTGGDEFVVIIVDSAFSLEKFQAQFQKFLSKNNKGIKGLYNDKINVAMGYCQAKDYPDYTLERLVEVADQEMYKNKALFYRENHIDRRRR